MHVCFGSVLAQHLAFHKFSRSLTAPFPLPPLLPFPLSSPRDFLIFSWLLFLPCTWGVALATPSATMPDMGLLALFGVGSVIMRGAGCKLLPLPLYTAGRNKQTPLATKNLLEDTDGLRRPPFY